MYYSFICFWLTLKLVYGSHAVIGDYKELNTKDCGITRLTNSFDDECFKWHKTPMSRLRAGRNATINEVPWIAHIFIKIDANYTGDCAGSVISDEWVLTAGHCLLSEDPYDYTIYFGFDSWESWKSKGSKHSYALEVHRHPDYISMNASLKRPMNNDLGLIKLETPITSFDTTELKSICLPKRNISNTKAEYVMSAGWGMFDRWQLPLQMGYKKLHVGAYPDQETGLEDWNLQQINAMLVTVIDNQAINCKGDSGSPVWQFHMGRAVLIGFMSFGHNVNKTLCESAGESAHWAVRVSDYIDWIQNVTKLQ